MKYIAAGVVSVNEDVSAEPYQYELTIEVSDGCLTASEILTVVITPPPSISLEKKSNILVSHVC